MDPNDYKVPAVSMLANPHWYHHFCPGCGRWSVLDASPEALRRKDVEWGKALQREQDTEQRRADAERAQEQWRTANEKKVS